MNKLTQNMTAKVPSKFNVFIDSDGVIADFDADLQLSGLSVNEFKKRAGSYLWLPEVKGAREALTELKLYNEAGLLDIWVATKTPSGTPYAYTEKVLWYREHFPWLEDRVIVLHNKSLLGGVHDILVDDRPHKANASLFTGTLLHFGSAQFLGWVEIMQYIRSKVQVDKKPFIKALVYERDSIW